MANNNIEDQILAGDKTILDVFADKSKDADDAIEYGMGLSPEELLDIAMSVTPMGGVKAGKGAISFLKGLLGRAKSKAKFPVGYGYPAKGKTLDQSLFELKEKGNVLTKVSKDASKYLAEDQKAIDESIKRMKGMRQFGKFNRQKWEK
jgi:hypothetical protein|tara:strand:- start:42 stop:485 length:444 start_codon:yes stop_codon:yes gene_type:complete